MGIFRFRYFDVRQDVNHLKVGTDAMLLGALAEQSDVSSILDIGTGTGVLALMMAQKHPLSSITAIELDQPSADEAKLNFANSPWSERLDIITGDVLNYSFSDRYDLIISNPPFHQDSLLNPDMEKARTRHADFLPLKDLFRKVQLLLSVKGNFWVILPFSVLEKALLLGKEEGLFPKRTITICGRPEKPVRVILQFSKEEVDEVTQEQMTIRSEDGNYTSEYILLTEDFHGTRL